MKIAQVIVVEGKNDTRRLQQFFDCDTIETHGTCLSTFTIDQIRRLQKARGIIVLTDPDAPGNQIRNAVNQAVPGCLNAFVEKEKAKTDTKVGVEHAGREALQEALANLVTMLPPTAETISAQDFYDLGLMGQPDSASRRQRAGQILHLGSGNARALRKRMNCLGITRQQLQEALQK